MNHIISFSGGKDSTALILWAKEHLEEFEVVFCDTGWEHDITYKYIDYINDVLCDGKLVIIKSKKYEGFEDMSIKRKRVPSVRARFCTQELKLFPMYDYIHDNHKEVELYVGIRADESHSRSKMKERNFDLDYYGCWINRPLIKWTAQDVFDIHKKHNIEPNPLYKMGFKRVGCFPCIMANQREVKLIAKHFPERIDRIRNLENKLRLSYFGVEYIPDRFCNSQDLKARRRIAFIDDVVKYVRDNPNQTEMFEPSSCMSYYNICE